ncbi:MAG: HAD family hydrolase [Candidatus Brocadiia bacterium]
MKLEGVIFDMDGVLCDSEPFIYEASRRMFVETYGINPKAEDFFPFVGAGEDRFIGGVAEKYGIRLDAARDKARTYVIYLEIIRGRLKPLPGVGEFVRRCRERRLKIAVASAADAVKVNGNLHQIGLTAETFDAILTGNDVRRKKPDPEIFLAAAARLGLRAENCLVIEDAVNGLRAGKTAGAVCLGITTKFDAATLRAAGADWTAPDLAHAPEEVFAGVEAAKGTA